MPVHYMDVLTLTVPFCPGEPKALPHGFGSLYVSAPAEDGQQVATITLSRKAAKKMRNGRRGGKKLRAPLNQATEN